LNKRNITVKVLLTDKEKMHLDKQIAISGLTKSKLLRDLIMGVKLKPQPPDEYYKVRKLLSNLTNNVNQLARNVNTTGNIRSPELQEIKSMINMCWEKLKTLG
jgi:hypothetical protein